MDNIFKQLFQYGFHNTDIPSIEGDGLQIKIKIWPKAGGTLIKFGDAFKINIGAMWRLHIHILNSVHLPIGAIIVGLIGIKY